MKKKKRTNDKKNQDLRDKKIWENTNLHLTIFSQYGMKNVQVGLKGKQGSFPKM
jgi:hypothetical protein